MYVTTGRLGEGRRIARSQVVELAQAADDIELGAHTVTHPHLDEISNGDARREIIECRAQLEELIGRAVPSFAYPHGSYSANVRRLVVDAGYESAAAIKNALSHPQDDPWAIARWTVRRTTTVDELAAVLRGDAPLAWKHERFRTHAYRSFRTAKHRLVGRTARTERPPFQSAVAPVAIRELDLSMPATDLEIGLARNGAPYDTVAVLVRDQGAARGWVTVPAPGSGVLGADDAPTGRPGPIPCHRHRRRGAVDVPNRTRRTVLRCGADMCADADAVIRCVRMVMERASGPFEVVVVENRPGRSGVRAALDCTFADDARITYVEETARGLSHARNAGIRAARGEFLAFIDDDIVVDPRWMASMRSAFAFLRRRPVPSPA